MNNDRTTIDPDASPRALESQLDAKRADLHRTLTQLEDRFNPEQVMDYVRENGGEIAGNLGRTFKQNPVPFVLTGVGLAWLMSAQSNANREPTYPRYRSDRYTGNPYYEEDDIETVRATRYSAQYRDRPSAGYATGGAGYSTSGSGDTGHDDDEGVMDTAKQKFAEAGDAISDATDRAKSSMAEMSDEAKARYESMQRDTSRRYSRMSEASKRRYAMLDDEARGRYDRARASAQRAAETARRQARSSAERGGEFLKEQPLVAGAIGAAIGALIGSLLPPSRVEDRTFGEQADRLRGTAREEFEQQVDNATTQANQVLSDASQTAEQKLEEARKKAEDAAKRTDEKAAEKANDAAKSGSAKKDDSLAGA